MSNRQQFFALYLNLSHTFAESRWDITYVPPKFEDADGNIFEGDTAWEEALNRFSGMEILAIPNRPFSGKPINYAARYVRRGSCRGPEEHLFFSDFW